MCSNSRIRSRLGGVRPARFIRSFPGPRRWLRGPAPFRAAAGLGSVPSASRPFQRSLFSDFVVHGKVGAGRRFGVSAGADSGADLRLPDCFGPAPPHVRLCLLRIRVGDVPRRGSVFACTAVFGGTACCAQRSLHWLFYVGSGTRPRSGFQKISRQFSWASTLRSKATWFRWRRAPTKNDSTSRERPSRSWGVGRRAASWTPARWPASHTVEWPSSATAMARTRSSMGSP